MAFSFYFPFIEGFTILQKCVVCKGINTEKETNYSNQWICGVFATMIIENVFPYVPNDMVPMETLECQFLELLDLKMTSSS